MNVLSFVYPFTLDVHLSGFWLLVIINKSALNVFACFVCVHV